MPKLECGFLTSGPAFSLEVPAGFSNPAMTSPIDISGDSGRVRGGREVSFAPPELQIPMTDYLRTIETLTSRDGYKVTVHQRDDEPIHWFLRWELATGVLDTHVRDDDGYDRVALIAEKLAIVEGDGLVSIIPEAPLRRAASSTPGYEERVTFFRFPVGARADLAAGTGPTTALELRRPSTLRLGITRQLDLGNGNSSVAFGSKYGVEVIAHGAGSLPDLALLALSVSESII